MPDERWNYIPLSDGVCYNDDDRKVIVNGVVILFIALCGFGVQSLAADGPEAARTARVAADRPGPENTGLSDRSLLRTPEDGATVEQDGATIENRHFTGTVHVKADDVTFRNCFFELPVREDGPAYGLRASYKRDDGTRYAGLVVEDCEFTGGRSCGIWGSNLTIRRCHFHDIGGDAVKMHARNLTMTDCYVARLGTLEGAHADGVQVRKGDNVVLRGNFFDMPIGVEGTRSNACVFLQSAEGPVTNVLIEGNWFNGGNYTIHADAGVTGLVVRGNRFGRDCRYGVKNLNGAEVRWEGNRWMESGEPIP